MGLFYRSLVGLFLYVYVAFDSFGAAPHIKSSVSFIGFFYETGLFDRFFFYICVLLLTLLAQLSTWKEKSNI